MTYVNAPIGAGQEGAGRGEARIACPTTSGTGSETTGIAIFNLRSLNAKTGIISRRLIPDVALIDPTVTASLPRNAIAATGFDCMSHALESLTARACPRRLNPAHGVKSPGLARCEPVLGHARRPRRSKASATFLVRAVSDATDSEARTEMMYAAMLRRHRLQRGRLPSAAWIVLRGVGSHRGLARRRLSSRQDARAARNGGRAATIRRYGGSLRRACPERHLHRCTLPRCESADADAADAGEVLAARVIELIARHSDARTALAALGFDDGQIDALATGAEPQYRVIRNAPKDVGRDDLEALFRAALRYW